MTTDRDDLLTDDEIVALAVDAGRSWPAPLPTVSVEDPAELGASAERGIRSLLARGAVVGQQLDPRLQAVTAAAGSSIVIVCYLADGMGRPLPDTVTHAAIGIGGSWLLDEVFPMGLHRFGRFEDAAAVGAYFSSIAVVVHEDGLADTYGAGATFCVSHATAEGARALAITRGSLVEQIIDASGAVVASRPVAGDPKTAVVALVEGVSSVDGMPS